MVLDLKKPSHGIVRREELCTNKQPQIIKDLVTETPCALCSAAVEEPGKAPEEEGDMIYTEVGRLTCRSLKT